MFIDRKCINTFTDAWFILLFFHNIHFYGSALNSSESIIFVKHRLTLILVALLLYCVVQKSWINRQNRRGWKIGSRKVYPKKKINKWTSCCWFVYPHCCCYCTTCRLVANPQYTKETYTIHKHITLLLFFVKQIIYFVCQIAMYGIIIILSILCVYIIIFLIFFYCRCCCSFISSMEQQKESDKK